MSLIGVVQLELLLRLENAPLFHPCTVEDIVRGYDETLPAAMRALFHPTIRLPYQIDLEHITVRRLSISPNVTNHTSNITNNTNSSSTTSLSQSMTTTEEQELPFHPEPGKRTLWPLMMLLIIPVAVGGYLGYRLYKRVENKLYRLKAFRIGPHDPAADEILHLNSKSGVAERRDVSAIIEDFDPLQDLVKEPKMELTIEPGATTEPEADGREDAVGRYDVLQQGDDVERKYHDVLRGCIVDHSEVNVGHLEQNPDASIEMQEVDPVYSDESS